MKFGIIHDFRNPLVIGMRLPSLDPQKVTRSLELFAKEVMPSFRQ